MKKEKSFLHNAWVIGVSTGIITYIITSTITSIVRNISIFASLKLVMGSVIGFILSVLKFRIPLWVILSGIIVSIGASKIIRLLSKTFGSAWQLYKMDFIKEWLFAWDYSGNSIVNIQAICDNCFCILSSSCKGSYYASPDDYLYCPNCNRRFKLITREILPDIEKIIINRLSTGSYANSQYYKKAIGSNDKTTQK